MNDKGNFRRFLQFDNVNQVNRWLDELVYEAFIDEWQALEDGSIIVTFNVSPTLDYKDTMSAINEAVKIRNEIVDE